MEAGASWDGQERRGMPESHHRQEDNPTWRWVAVSALGAITTITIVALQWGFSFATTLNNQVQSHEKTIAIIQQDVTYIKDGVDKLIQGQH